jgi:hypothetical protein
MISRYVNQQRSSTVKRSLNLILGIAASEVETALSLLTVSPLKKLMT